MYCGRDIVPASIKINPRDIPAYGWKDVPLWITSGDSHAAGPPTRRGTCPFVEVRLPHPFGTTQSLFTETVALIDMFLARVDQGKLTMPGLLQISNPVWSALRDYRDRPLSELIDYLRDEADPWISAAAGELVLTEDVIVTVPVLNNDVVRTAYTDAAANGTLFTLQRHLFVTANHRSPRIG